MFSMLFILNICVHFSNFDPKIYAKNDAKTNIFKGPKIIHNTNHAMIFIVVIIIIIILL